MRFSVLTAFALLPALGFSAPLPKRADIFVQRSYDKFQISQGVAGNALAEAEAVFVRPLDGVDLKTVSQTDLKAMEAMRVAAEEAETSFNSAIAQAGGVSTSAGATLQIGKIKNKVLKLRGLAFINEIKLAQGGGSAVQAAFDDCNTKLAANVKIDQAQKGKASKGVVASTSTSSAAAVKVNQAASAPNCFLVGSQTLPKEVSDGLAALSGVTCGSANAFGKIPDVKSGSVSFSSIDLSKSSKSALGFALDTFKIDPATAKLSDLDDSLKVYLAVEAGLRSLGGNSADLTNVKDVKFFLQFQQARINAAQGVQVGAAGTVAHQLGKVQKNALKATAAEKAALLALSK